MTEKIKQKDSGNYVNTFFGNQIKTLVSNKNDNTKSTRKGKKINATVSSKKKVRVTTFWQNNHLS